MSHTVEPWQHRHLLSYKHWLQDLEYLLFMLLLFLLRVTERNPTQQSVSQASKHACDRHVWSSHKQVEADSNRSCGGSKIWLLNDGFGIVMWTGPSPGLVCGTSFPSTNLQGQVLIIPLRLKYGIWVCLTSNWNFLFEKLLPASKQWSVAGLPLDTNGIRNCIKL